MGSRTVGQRMMLDSWKEGRDVRSRQGARGSTWEGGREWKGHWQGEVAKRTEVASCLWEGPDT
jgi:hypothetical protein